MSKSFATSEGTQASAGPTHCRIPTYHTSLNSRVLRGGVSGWIRHFARRVAAGRSTKGVPGGPSPRVFHRGSTLLVSAAAGLRLRRSVRSLGSGLARVEDGRAPFHPRMDARESLLRSEAREVAAVG